MAVIREHLAAQGPRPAQRSAERALDRRQLPVHRDVRDFGSRRAEATSSSRGRLERQARVAFGLTEPQARLRRDVHGDARGARDRDGVDGWRIDGEKMWTTGMHVATHCMRVRAHQRRGRRRARASPASSCRASARREDRGVPLDLQHADRPSARQLHGRVGAGRGAVRRRSTTAWRSRRRFVHQNRIRQAASSLGAAVYCIDESVQLRARAQAVRQGARRATRRSSGRWSSWRRRPRCCAC